MKPTRFHHPLSKQDLVDPVLKEIDSITAGSNPFHHDLWRMGVDINDSYTAMFNSAEKPTEQMVLVNRETGQRFVLDFEPRQPTWRKVVKFEQGLDKILGEEFYLFDRTHYTTSEPTSDFAIYRSTDASTYVDRDDVMDLWFLFRGYMIQVSLLNTRDDLVDEWARFTFEEPLTDEEIEQLYDNILEATPMCTYGLKDVPKNTTATIHWKYPVIGGQTDGRN